MIIKIHAYAIILLGSMGSLFAIDPPSQIYITPEDRNTIQIAWSSVSEAVSYDIERSEFENTGYSTLVSATTDTSYTDNSVNNATEYFYRINASSATETSEFSSVANAKTSGNQGSFNRMEDLPSAAGRIYRAQGFVIDDNVYLTGLFDNATLTFKFDPLTDFWVEVAANASSPGRYGFGFGINDRGYYGTGGSSSKNFYEYVPEADTWRSRAQFGGVGRTLAVGFAMQGFGYGGLGGSTTDFWQFDPVSNSWTQVADIPEALGNEAVAATVSNKAYVGKNTTMYEYDPVANQWLRKSNFPTTASAMFSVGPLVYVIGTNLSTNIYDPVTESWSSGDNFPGVNQQARFMTSNTKKGYIGPGGATTNRDFWEFVPAEFIEAPSNLQGTTSGLTVSLTWEDNSADEQGFEIYRRRVGATAFKLIATTQEDIESYQDIPPLSQSSYLYMVKAKGDLEGSAFSNEITVDIEGLTPPDMVAATTLSENSIELLWRSQEATATSFDIYRSDAANGTFSIVGSTQDGVTLFVDEGLTENTYYYYRVKASSSSDSSSLSHVAYATTYQSATEDSWAQETNFAGSARFGAASFSIGNKGYYGMGFNNRSDFWSYDQETGTWTQIANSLSATYYAVGFSGLGKGYVTHGHNGSKNLLIYDPETNVWSFGTDIPYSARGSFAFTIGNFAYVGTGSGVNQFYEYDMLNNRWKQRANFPKTMDFGTAFSVGQNGYAGYGSITLSGTTGVPEYYKYDPITNDWTQITSPPFAAEGEAALAFAIGKFGYVGLGSSGTSDVFAYNTANNTWTKVKGIGKGNDYTNTYTIGNKGYMTDGNRVTQEHWEYTPTSLLPPTELALTAGSDQVTITWKDISNNEEKFEILRSNLRSGEYKKLGEVSENQTSFMDNNVARGDSVFYKIVAVKGFLKSLGSEVIATKIEGIATPKWFTGYGVSVSTIKLIWEDVTDDETGFEISRAIGNGSFLVIDTADANEEVFFDTDLVSNTAYRYKLRAIGSGGSANTMSGDIYTLRSSPSNEWTEEADFPGDARQYPAGTTIGDKIYVAGGGTSTFVDFYEYDATTKRWNTLESTPVNRHYQPFLVGLDDRIFFGNGFTSSPQDDVYEFDLTTTEWNFNSLFPGGNSYSAFGFNAFNQLYIFSGYNNNAKFFYRFNPATGEYTELAKPTVNVSQYNWGFVIGHELFVSTGGSSVWKKYNFTTNAWADVENFPGGNVSPHQSFALGGKGYVFSGANGTGLWQYDPENDDWTEIEGDFSEVGVRSFGLGLTLRNQGFVLLGSTNAAIGKKMWSFTPTSLLPPLQVVATPGMRGEIDITWVDNDDNGTGFSIYRAPQDSEDAFEVIGSIDGSTTTFTDQNLLSGIEYFYRLKATTSTNQSTFSATASATTTGISTPSGFTASTVSQTRIDLSWEDIADNESGYEIYRSKGNSQNFELINTVSANISSFTDDNLDRNNDYFYRLRAVSATDSSDFVFSDARAGIFPPVISRIVTNTNSQRVELEWTNANPSITTAFEVWRSTDSLSGYTKIADTDVFAYNDTTAVDAFTDNFYRIRAVNEEDTSGFSGVSTAISTWILPPKNVKFEVISSTEIRISWENQSVSTSGFMLQYGTVNYNFRQGNVATDSRMTVFESPVNRSEYLISNLTADTRYYIWMGARQVSNGEVSYSTGARDESFSAGIRTKPLDGTWTLRSTETVTSSAQLRLQHVAFTINNKGYIGMGSSTKKDLWEYDPVENAWTQKASYPGSGNSSNMACFVIKGKAYAGMGYTSITNASNEFYEYDPAENSWGEIADFPGDNRSDFVYFNTDNYGYVGLGRANSPVVFKDVYQYNPEDDSWNKIADYPDSARYYSFGFSIGNEGFIGGGRGVDNDYSSSFYSYTESGGWEKEATLPFTASSINNNVNSQSFTFTIKDQGFFELFGVGQYQFDASEGKRSWTSTTSRSPLQWLSSGSTNLYYQAFVIGNLAYALNNRQLYIYFSGIELSAPDLKFDVDPTFSTSVFNAGASFTTSVIVENQGDLASNNGKVEVLLSGEVIGSLDLDQIDVESKTSSKSIACTIPSSVQAGEYTLSVRIEDSEDRDISNNEFSTTIQVFTDPDFTISNLSYPVQFVNDNDIVDLSFGVLNQGGKTADAGNIKVYLSDDSVFDASSAELLTFDGNTFEAVGSIPAGETINKNKKVSLGSGLGQGTKYIIVVTDADEFTDEANEQNNAVSIALNVNPAELSGSSLAVDPVSQVDGGDISISGTVQNTGVGEVDAATSVQVRFYLQGKEANTDTDKVLLGQTVIAGGISSSGSKNYDETFKIPENKPAGQYEVTAVIDEGESISEEDDNNNTNAINLTIVNPDLTLQNTAIQEDSLVEGSVVNVITNIGNSGAGVFNQGRQVNVKAYLSNNNTFSDDDIEIGSQTVVSEGVSPSGQQAIGQLSYDLPNRVDAGDYFIILVLDSDDNVVESDEQNNRVAVSLHVLNITPVFSNLTSPDSVVFGSSNFTVSVEVSADAALDPVKSVFKFKTFAGAGDFNEITFSDNETNLSATLAVADLEGIGVFGFFEAQGANQRPATSDTVFVYLKHTDRGISPNQEAPTLKSVGKSKVTEDDKAEDIQKFYQIISIPLNLDNPTVADVFEDDLGELDPKEWRISRYDPNTSLSVELKSTDAISRGAGYWLIIKESGKSITTGAGSSVLDTKDGTFEIQLLNGWNQIGNPFNFTLDWTQVEALNPTSDIRRDEFYIYDQGFKKVTTLRPFEGGFIRANSTTMLRVPASARVDDASNGRLLGQNTTSTSDGAWSLPVNITNEYVESNYSGFGMTSGASNGLDEHDRLRPPKFANYANLTFENEFISTTKGVSQEIAALEDHHIYDFYVESNITGETTLSWDNSSVQKLHQQMILFDHSKQKKIDMKLISQYRYERKSGEKFSVYFGNRAFIERELKPSLIYVGEPYPSPATEVVAIPFTIPASIEYADVKLTLLDAKGREVATRIDQRVESGFHNSTIALSEYRLAKGVYFAKLVILANRMEKTVIKKLLFGDHDEKSK